ncbi:hypothetical protein [Armatimonas rosea]|uniref:Uncharacterized protein n=1 Tax=Armatimonas rosea TaxID=685828 RepID=A0A7W9W4Z1_ARMRO|nr:hypothetical protein [Armatimonas rosea]MBB6048360.1 hypothetical protein [Armatimonas rosea]
MKLVRALTAPKDGNSDEQYEDAWALSETQPTLAVADGASAAVYAREWAELLVADFASGAPFPSDDEAFWHRVSGLGTQWQKTVGTGATSWYAQEKLPQGSQASLLVLDVDSETRQLTARAIGDVCLFLVVDDKLHYAFPLTKSKQFNTHPGLVATDPTALKDRPEIVRFTAKLPPAPVRLFACTDAVAAWFLLEYERKRKPWSLLPPDPIFPAWLKGTRDSGALKNDDVTIIELEV